MCPALESVSLNNIVSAAVEATARAAAANRIKFVSILPAASDGVGWTPVADSRALTELLVAYAVLALRAPCGRTVRISAEKLAPGRATIRLNGIECDRIVGSPGSLSERGKKLGVTVAWTRLADEQSVALTIPVIDEVSDQVGFRGRPESV